MGFYNIALAIFDILALIVSFIAYFPITVSSEWSLISSLSCKLITFFLRIFTQVPSWLQVMVSFDRMLSVKYPNRFLILNKKAILTCLIGIIILFIMVISIPIIYMDIVVEQIFNSTTNTSSTKKTCTASVELLLARDLIGLSSRTIIPFIFMITFNIIIIRKLLKTKWSIFKNKSQQNIRKRSNKKEYQFAFSIIAINISFLVILSPLTIGQILKYIFMMGLNVEQQKVSVIVATLDYFCFISVYIVLLNNAFSFFINLIFNKLFRKELKAILANSVSAVGLNIIFTSHESSSRKNPIVGFLKN